MSSICKDCEKRHSCTPVKMAIYVSPLDDSCPFYERDTHLSETKKMLDNLMNSKIEQVRRDLDVASLYPSIMPLNPAYGKMTITTNSIPKIKNVIFNNPATIVFWEDGTKTIVKCQDGDVFDPEKGLTMAISKKALGNKGNYCNEIKKWLPEEKDDADFNETVFHIPDPAPDYIVDAIENAKKAAERFWTSLRGTNHE